jgi:hypothetical protein
MKLIGNIPVLFGSISMFIGRLPIPLENMCIPSIA